jgi:RNA polymerase sigma-70 factor (ECF subfamily)
VLTSIQHGAGRPEVDHTTFDKVLGHYQAEVYAFAVHLTLDRAAANALYQEALLTAFDAFDERDRPTDYRSWLFTIVTDAFLSDRHEQGAGSSSGEQQMVMDAGTPPVQTDRLDAHGLYREVEAFVATLPGPQWVALVQRRYLNRGYAEIAETLRCSEVAARASVYEALRAMRAHIGDRWSPSLASSA